MTADPVPRGPRDQLLETLVRVLGGESLDASLGEAARLVASVAHAPVSTVFLLRGAEIAGEYWHPSDEETRQRFGEAFREAVNDAISRDDAADPPAVLETPGGTCFRTSKPSRGRDFALVASLAWPDATPPRAPDPEERVDLLVELLASKVAHHDRESRFDAQGIRYERWFRTLDQQLRLLDRERQKLSAVVHQSDFYVFAANVSGTITWTNKAMANLGSTNEAGFNWVGRACAELCARLGSGAGKDACAHCPLARAIETNRAAHHELRPVSAGVAQTFYMTAIPIRGPDGLPHEVMTMLQDLSDLRVLRKSESRYRQLFERSANAIVMVEPATRRIVLANAMTSRMLGYARDQLLDLSLADLLLPDESARLQPLLSSVHDGGFREGLECRLRHREGAERVAVVRPSRFDLDGEEVVMLEFLDITDRKRAEAALWEREQELRQSQKMEAVGRLAGGIAHGFNNLLSVIMGRVELMRHRLGENDPLRRDAEQIHSACVQGAWLTRQLLTFGRREMASPQPLDLQTVVREMGGMLRCLLGEEIELVSAPGPAPAHVRADRALIEQVLLNLVINARDAMPRGGAITVELSSVELDRDAAGELGALDPGPYVLLTVSDNGSGMDEETRSRLFEPFFTTKDRARASGLGLSIVYGIVTEGGGRIQVSSAPGIGTTVRVYLPRIEEVFGLPDSDRPRTHVEPASATILLVEDDDAVRAVIREALELEGFTVIAAQNGHEALEIAERHRGPLHLLLTDVVMPQMEGGVLAQRLLPTRPEMRVMFVSGYADDAVVRRGVIEGRVPFLQKPFSLEQLGAKVREALGAPAPVATGHAPLPPPSPTAG